MSGGPTLSTGAVREIAALVGVPLDDEAAAARVAAGAGAAVAAVRAALDEVLAADGAAVDAALFGREPSEYLALLEALADPPDGAHATTAAP